MGYIICIIVGGIFGLLCACLLAVSKENKDRKELIEMLKKEIYEDIYSSKESVKDKE